MLILSSIAIELNVPPDGFSSIAIELTFVILGHGLKKSRFSPLWYLCAWDKDFLSSITSLDNSIPGARFTKLFMTELIHKT